MIELPDWRDILGLPLQMALTMFDGREPSVVEIEPPRGRAEDMHCALRVLRYDPARHELTVARFQDSVKTD